MCRRRKNAIADYTDSANSRGFPGCRGEDERGMGGEMLRERWGEELLMLVVAADDPATSDAVTTASVA